LYFVSDTMICCTDLVPLSNSNAPMYTTVIIVELPG